MLFQGIVMHFLQIFLIFFALRIICDNWIQYFVLVVIVKRISCDNYFYYFVLVVIINVLVVIIALFNKLKINNLRSLKVLKSLLLLKNTTTIGKNVIVFY